MSVEQVDRPLALGVPPRRTEEITSAITRQVMQGDLRPGARLPSERELCRRFGASRNTVRRALAALVASGLLRAEQGRGTFVQPPRIGETTNALLSFSELASARSLTPSSLVLHQETRPATLDESALFALAPGAPLFVLRRLRMLDGLPVSVDESHLPLTRLPGIATVRFETASLYATLAELGHAPARADYTIEAVSASADLARALKVPAGSPLLRAETVSVDSRQLTVEHGEMFYRADRYRFTATLTRGAVGPASA